MDHPVAGTCTGLLEARLALAPRVASAVLATVDGRAVAHALRPGIDNQPARFAAIATSLLALAESFAREAVDGDADYASIATGSGSIVIVRVPSRARLHALCVCASAEETFAMVLRFALDTARRLARTLDAAPA